MTSGEPHSLVCSAFPLSSPATNLSWELDSSLQIARNMIHFAPENITSSRSSSSSSSPGDWEFFSTERRIVLTPRDNNHGAVISCYGDHPGLQKKLSVSITLSVLGNTQIHISLCLFRGKQLSLYPRHTLCVWPKSLDTKCTCFNIRYISFHALRCKH